MDLRNLELIVASARNGSFSAAAHEFNVRQPIVSKRVKRVEEELGVQLFDRLKSGARLTPAGEEFVTDAPRILGDVGRLRERAKARAAGKLGRIVVGFYKSLSAGGFRRAINDFRERYPQVEVDLIEAPFIELTAGLLSGGLDTPLILGDTGKCEVLASLALWSEHLVVALPTTHRLADRPLVYWQELKDEIFLISHHDPGSDIRNILLRHLAGPSDQPRIVTRHLSRENILSEVASGQGVALQCQSAKGLAGLGVAFRPIHDGAGATRLGYIACWKPDNANPVLPTFLNSIRPPGS